MRLPLWMVMFSACSGAAPMPPAPATTAPVAPRGAAASTPEPEVSAAPEVALPPGPTAIIPLAIDRLDHLPKDLIPGRGRFGMDCWTALTDRIDDAYWIGLYEDRHVYGESQPMLLRTKLTLDEIAACLEPKPPRKRKPPKDPRIRTLEMVDSFASVGDGWLLVGGPLTLANVLFTAKGASNPLGALLPTQPSGDHWTAVAADFTSELLGVPSRGLVFEGDWLDPATVAVTARLVFADAAAARLARARLDQPPRQVMKSAFAELLPRARDYLLAHGVLRVEGSAVVWRGTPTADYEDHLGVFRSLAHPLGRAPSKELPLGAPCEDAYDCSPGLGGCYKRPGEPVGYCTSFCHQGFPMCTEAGMVCKQPKVATNKFIATDICMKKK